MALCPSDGAPDVLRGCEVLLPPSNAHSRPHRPSTPCHATPLQTQKSQCVCVCVCGGKDGVKGGASKNRSLSPHECKQTNRGHP
ncbi:hypothetical protein E2C01_031885 [Portunus trituberculatus]|uniref:Uncharacterized protein n=1 Tax=Portunus trituberculatus TaxID=210409 RepID=A0A5B7EZD3_PORTR|nr:hypothetical protein [Portunus trituberculatus]